MLQDFARRLAPTVYLDASEPYWPCCVADYARNCELWRGGAKVAESATPALLAAHDSPDALLALKASGRAGALDRAAYPCGAEIYADIRENVHAGTKTIEIVYWIFFAFNGTLASHYGDRERVIVTADAWGTPLEVFFSSHNGGFWKSWWSSDVTRTDSGGFEVYVCRESHAMSPRPGTRPRLFGLGSDTCWPASDGGSLPYRLRFTDDVPELGWKGLYNGKDPFLPPRGWSPRTSCTPDTFALLKLHVGPRVVVGLLACSLAGIACLVVAAAWSRRWWVLLPSLPLVAVAVLAVGMLGTDSLPGRWF